MLDESVFKRLKIIDGARIDRDEMRRRAGNAMARGLPSFMYCVNEAREWVIVGGGPSINDQVDIIRALKRRGANVVSVNKSHDWLLEHGIVPWGHILLDPKEWVADYVKRPRMDVRYFVASQCHDLTFEALKGFPVFLWHAGQTFPEGDEPGIYLREYWPKTPWHMVPGPTTVGLRAPIIGHNLGADKFHLIGFDSSRVNGKMHGYDKTEAQDAQSINYPIKYKGGIATFSTNTHMLKQLHDFDRMIKDVPENWKTGRLRKEFCVTVYGSGLLPFYAACLELHSEPRCNENPKTVGGFYWERTERIDFGDLEKIVLSESILAPLGEFKLEARR